MSENNKKIDYIKEYSIDIKKLILKSALSGGSSSAHIGGALSASDLIACLFSSFLKIDPKKYNQEDRDRFILSKGHGCLVLYAALVKEGFMNESDLETFEKNNSDLLGHPIMNKKKGIEFSTGSLGMGLSLGIGTSLAAKKKKKKFRTYVLIGDGECNEGSIWESAMSASHFKLDNITVILDKNDFQQTGTTTEIMNSLDIEKKWKSFGWDTRNIDGHNISEILQSLESSVESKHPFLIVANTIKGKGVSFSENNNDWHHAVLTQSNYDKAIIELEKIKEA